MSRKAYVVELSSDERQHLEALISKGKSSAKTILKARILLKSDQSPLGPNWTDDRIVEALDSVCIIQPEGTGVTTLVLEKN